MAREFRMTREQFLAIAKDLRVVIDGSTFEAVPQQNKTGSVGWKLNAKGTITMPDGTKVDVQIGMNVTCIGSGKL